MTPQQWLDVLCDRIRYRIEASGWTLGGSTSPSDALMAAAAPGGVAGAATDHVIARRILVADQMPYVILAAFVSAEPDAFSDPFASLLWWAAQARQELDHSRRDDLHLVIVVRPTELRRAAWLALASSIENNEHLCRKFVWVAPEAPDQAVASVDLLLDRSFLARPWHVAPLAAARTLDPLAGLLDDNSLTALASTAELEQWLALLSRSIRAGQDVAEQMVRALSPQAGEST